MLRGLLALGLALAAHCLRVQGGARPEKRGFCPRRHRRACRTPPAKHRLRTQIVGGTVVEDPAELPFVAWLGASNGTEPLLFCGGGLISERIVLTAGHCLFQDDVLSSPYVRVRLRLTDSSAEGGITLDAADWMRHPAYDDVRLANDVALLLLNDSVPESLVRPMRISDGSRSFERSGPKTIAGWGSASGDCGHVDSLLRKAEVPLGAMDGPNCSAPGAVTITGDVGFDSASQGCAGDYRSSHYPGCGDSGGPVLAWDGDWWTAVGVVSYGHGPEFPYPDVFTRVGHFRDWIDQASAELLSWESLRRAGGPRDPYT